MKYIYYKKGYKYQLVADYIIETDITPGQVIETDYIILTTEGLLHIKSGYAWDGPSGPTIDTPNFMRGSLVHDALYQLMRQGYLNADIHRELADRLLQRMCIEDGMPRIRAWWVYKGVHFGGNSAADPKNKKPIIRAP